MTDLLDPAIGFPPAAIRAEPFTVAEIDDHPDAARIWATVRFMRAAHEDAVDKAYDQGERDGARAERELRA